MRPGTVTDSRGVEHELRPALLREAQRMSDPRSLRLWRLRRDIDKPVISKGQRRLLGWLFGGAYGVMVLLIMLTGLTGVPVELALGVAVLLFLVATVGLFRLARSMSRRGLEWIQRQIATIRICPCCAYDLVGLEAQEDGCTVCPECGAAWWIPVKAGG